MTERPAHSYFDATPNTPRPSDGDRSPTGLEMVPGLARVAANAGWHTGSWAAGAYLRAGRRAVAVIIAPGAAIDTVRTVAQDAGRLVRSVVQSDELERRLAGTPGTDIVRVLRRVLGEVVPADGGEHGTNGNGHSPVLDGDEPLRVTLRDGGAELLRRSRDVHYEVDAHPAYARMLSEIAPDEARILRLLLLDGPQAIVDVRTGGPMGLVRSHLISGGLSMIGPRAGCRYPDRVPSYLNNLFRLGLIWFSRETLRDHQPYQVLEAQPDVLAATHKVTAAKLVRRSIHLTPFGEDFCRVCFAEEASNLDALPVHSAPRQAEKAPAPPKELLDA